MAHLYDLLIVEDDSSIIELYTQAFQTIESINLNVANEGYKATEKIEKQRFDCIILDIKLPGINGLQIASIIRQSKLNRNTPVFIVSGNLDHTNLAIAENYGVIDKIRKPFVVTEVLDKVVTTLNSRKKVFYDSGVINMFINSAKQIFEHYFESDIMIGRPRIKDPKQTPRGSLTGIISLSGDKFSGSMALSSNAAFIEYLSKSLFKSIDHFVYSEDLGIDALGEICNQIAGKVKIEFSKIDQNLIIGIPQVIAGRDVRLYHQTNNPILFVPMGKNYMGCDLEFCFNSADIKTDNKKSETDHLESGCIFFE